MDIMQTFYICLHFYFLHLLIDFGHKDTIYRLKFGWLKFDKSQTIRQTFLLYSIIHTYMHIDTQIDNTSITCTWLLKE